MKKSFIQTAERLRAMPPWAKGLAVILLILLLYQVFLELSYFVDLTAPGSCPDCGG